MREDHRQRTWQRDPHHRGAGQACRVAKALPQSVPRAHVALCRVDVLLDGLWSQGGRLSIALSS